MNKKWTLHIENLAKIREADVEISPLLCFVGDNNSGKSYLMSLLWGILSFGKDIFPKAPSEAKTYLVCETFLRENWCSDTLLDESVEKVYLNWFNDLLSANKRALLRKIFNYDVEIGKLEIRAYSRNKSMSLQWVSEGERYSSGNNYIKFPQKDELPTRDELLRMNAYICWNLLMEGIAAPLYTPVIKGRRNGEPIYLPASRTGFMLTYPQLIESALQFFSSMQQSEGTTLTQPYVDFLQLLTKFEAKKEVNRKYKWCVEYIEQGMMVGNLVVKKDTIPIIKFLPKGTTKEMPLYVASSIVAEVSPLLLLLKSNINFKTLIIEEPEAHLHPELQKKIARLIINILNTGTLVWITTHSDTMLQHINNMLKLRNHSEKKKLMEDYGYTENDLLNGSDVNMYQFRALGNGKTELETLSKEKNGFIVPTFNDALEKIVDEVYAFQED